MILKIKMEETYLEKGACTGWTEIVLDCFVVIKALVLLFVSV